MTHCHHCHQPIRPDRSSWESPDGTRTWCSLQCLTQDHPNKDRT